MEKITEQLLDKIFYLQEDLVEERQKNTNLEITLKKCEKALKDCKNIIDHLREERSKQERKTRDKEIYTFYIGIGFTILVYLLIKILLWYFF